MKKIWMFFWLVGVVACQTSRPVKDSTYLDSIEQARTLVRQASQDGNFPGIAVAVAVEGKLVWSEGFGYADDQLWYWLAK